VIGVAIIGCGLVGVKRAEAMPPDLRVLVVYDIDSTKAAALAARLEAAPRVATSVDEALRTAGVELAIVATIHRDLAPVTRAALEAGCNVLVEKPGGRNSSEAAEVSAAASRAGRLVRVGFNHRFHPAVRRAKELVGAHDWGHLLHVRARYGQGGRVGYESEWRMKRDLSGGGELLDQGVHLIDLTRFLVGEASLVFAELRTDFWKADVEDNAFLALRPEQGGFAWLHASWTEWKNTFSFELALRDAKVEIRGLGGSYGTERLTVYEMSPEMGPPATTAWEFPQADTSWRLEIEDVVAAIEGRAAVGATIEDAVATLRIVDQAYAAELGPGRPQARFPTASPSSPDGLD
jgi:predicted dehydrogenase